MTAMEESINMVSPQSTLSTIQLNSEEDRLSDQDTKDQGRSELGSQIDDNDNGQIDFNEIVPDQVSKVEITSSYERTKPEVHYHQLLQDMGTRVRYILGEDEQQKELKIQSDTQQ